MSERGTYRGGGRGGGSGQYHHRGGRGGRGRGDGSRGGASAGGEGGTGERAKKENILDLGKYLDKDVTVKFNGGREGES